MDVTPFKEMLLRKRGDILSGGGRDPLLDVRRGADEVARLDAVTLADVDTKTFHARFRSPRAGWSRRSFRLDWPQGGFPVSKRPLP